MTEPSRTGLPNVILERGIDMEIAVGADAIEEWLVETIGPEWRRYDMYRRYVPWDEVIKRYWRVRGIS